MSFCGRATSVPSSSNYNVCEFQGNLLVLFVKTCHLCGSEGNREVTFEGLGVIFLDASECELYLCLGPSCG